MWRSGVKRMSVTTRMMRNVRTGRGVNRDEWSVANQVELEE
jgi:hypothetical protein